MRNRLRETREAQGLRLEQVVGVAGISLYYLRKLEKEEHAPTLPVARAIAQALGSTLDELFPPVEAA